LETDEVVGVTVGTALWGVALVVTLALQGRLDDGRDSWAWISAAGLFLGLLGIRYVRRRRAAQRAEPDQDQPHRPA
jgi:hypothetical protein